MLVHPWITRKIMKLVQLRKLQTHHLASIRNVPFRCWYNGGEFQNHCGSIRNVLFAAGTTGKIRKTIKRLLDISLLLPDNTTGENLQIIKRLSEMSFLLLEQLEKYEKPIKRLSRTVHFAAGTLPKFTGKQDIEVERDEPSLTFPRISLTS